MPKTSCNFSVVDLRTAKPCIDMDRARLQFCCLDFSRNVPILTLGLPSRREIVHLYLGLVRALYTCRLSAPIVGMPRVNRTGRCTSQIVSRYCVSKLNRFSRQGQAYRPSHIQYTAAHLLMCIFIILLIL
eukprot:COSAG05_NODE_2853_length_2570_cov_2.961149_3_plen_130_part_00